MSALLVRRLLAVVSEPFDTDAEGLSDMLEIAGRNEYSDVEVESKFRDTAVLWSVPLGTFTALARVGPIT